MYNNLIKRKNVIDILTKQLHGGKISISDAITSIINLPFNVNEKVNKINFCPYCGNDYLETDVEEERLYCGKCGKEFTVMIEEN